MYKIAIIEDDPMINQMYRMKFEAEGFKVEIADNGFNGLDLLNDYLPDLVLLDLQMPHMDGLQTLKEIRASAALKTIPVLILTNTGSEDLAEFVKLNIEGFITKAEMTPKEVVKLAISVINKKHTDKL